MTPTTATRTATRKRGIDQLPRNEQSSKRNVGLGLAAVIGSLLLLVGVPVALVLLVGNPLPSAGPSKDWLTADVNADLVINVLAVLVWLVWVHFVVCFLSEWRAIRRGRMPGNVVLGGGSQLLARRLVAGLLMLSGGLSLAQGLTTTVSADEAGSGRIADTISAVTTDSNRAGAAVSDVSKAGDTPAAQTATGTKHYEVMPPQGRTTTPRGTSPSAPLGDGMRWKEIYDLNKSRLQPDGRRYTDADLIRPGWQLLLPADAKGPGVTVHAPAAPHLAPLGSTDTSVGGAQTLLQPNAAVGGSLGSGAGGAAVGGQSDQAPGTNADWLLLGGGLILAGALRALTAHRGPFGEPDEGAAELAAAADVRRAEFLDNALRSLAEMRTAHDLPMPDVRFVYVNDEQVVLHLLTELEAPEAPWTVGEDQRSWSLRADDLQLPGTGVPAPYPSLVNVATTHGYDILVDLELAPGLVAVGGAVGVAREVAMAMAMDLTTHGWSDDIDVVMVGFGDHVADLDTGRARQVTDLDQLLAEVDNGQARISQVLSQLGVQGVLQGRQAGAASACAPMIAFLSGSPTAEQAQRLSQLTAGGRTAFSVVCVGDSPSARWRFVVDASGHFESTAIGLSGEARRIDREAQRHLRAMLADAQAARTASADLFENSSPAAIAAGAAPADTVAAATAAVPDPASSAVAVRLLGPVSVEAPGKVDDARRGLLSELVVMAALHPDGLHPAVLRSSLWPRGVEDDVVEARIADATAWLGTGTDGQPRLTVDGDGRVRLSADVGNDYAVLVAAAQARGQESGQGEVERLLHALNQGTGEVFSGPGKHYAWLTFAREARQCRMLTASVARRAADLATAASRHDVAMAALRKGLVMVPTSEALWRTLLRIQAQHAPATVDATISEMYSALQTHGVTHEPETEALVIELAPGRERVRGA